MSLPLQRGYEGPWSFLCETTWSLTSPQAKRISGPIKFRSSPKKDFFNTIKLRSDIDTETNSALSGCRMSIHYLQPVQLPDDAVNSDETAVGQRGNGADSSVELKTCDLAEFADVP